MTGRLSLTIVVLGLFLHIAGCRESADSFFSGRPSGMAKVHNRIIGGPPEAMLELLRVPSRFPDATEAQIANWQDSLIAWWRSEKQEQLMVDSLGKLSKEEKSALADWVCTRETSISKEKALALGEITSAVKEGRSVGGRQGAS